MKRSIQILLMVIAVIAASCKGKESMFIVSGYTAESQPDIALYALRPDETPEKLTEFSCGDNPSFFAGGKNNLFYFINEVDSFDLKYGGGITTLRIDKTNMTIEKVSSINQRGAGPCHIIVSDDGGYLITANYGSGSVSVIRLNEEGIPDEVTDVLKYGERSHPHMTHYNKRSNTYYITDLGLDRIYLLRLDTENGILIDSKAPYFKTEDGTGPRHMVSDASDVNLFVMNELNSSISVYNTLSDIPELKQTVSSLPEGFAEKNFCADIHLSPNGKRLYGSNRGHNSIVVFNIAKDGKLSDPEFHICGGDWPRNFTLSPNGRQILIANQRSGIVSVFRTGPKGAISDDVRISLPFNAPACVRFIE